VERMETIVTAPGRQASNADELVDVIVDATRAHVSVLSAEDEGRLAWEGAVSQLASPPPSIAVVDLGGGSCEVAVGGVRLGPTWVASCEGGALRVTSAWLSGTRPGDAEVAAARRGIRELLTDFEPPRPDAALAVGGTARAVAKIVGPRFGGRKLDALTERFAREGAAAVTDGLDITSERSETLLGGTLVLSEIARRLDSKLPPGSGGLREGAALALARAHTAAA